MLDVSRRETPGAVRGRPRARVCVGGGSGLEGSSCRAVACSSPAQRRTREKREGCWRFPDSAQSGEFIGRHLERIRQGIRSQDFAACRQLKYK